MDFKIFWFLPVALISSLFVTVVIPAIVRTANKMNLFDTQDDRKVHRGNVPRLGGISFLPAILFSLLMVISAMSIYSPLDLSFKYGPITQVMLAMAGCVILYLVGIVDDVIGVSYKYKFVIQIMASLLICASGLWINNLHGIFGIHELHPIFGIPLTIVVAVLIINSINLIDGIDGLASGLCIMGTAGYSLVFFHGDMNIYMILAAAMIGVLVVFYLYNTLGKPGVNKTFMGDTGSLTMGYLLAFFAIKLTTIDKPILHATNDGGYLIYALSLILIPVMDVFRVFFARIRDGKGPFFPDKRHIHHKFMALGFSMRQTRYLIFSISVSFFALNIFLFGYLGLGINWLVLIDAIVWITMNIMISSRVKYLRSLNDPVALKFSEIGAGYKFRRRRKRRN